MSVITFRFRFQRIANAYEAELPSERKALSDGEVLSDPQRRSFYDSTGCLDAEELDDGGFMRPEDLFAAFFGGGMAQDLDDEEQAMLDEFLKFSGGFSFKKKKGRRKGRAKAAFEQAFLAMMPSPTCPAGHALKRKKADGDYDCDVCEKDIKDGTRLHDCRKCDFSMCVRRGGECMERST